MSLFDDDIGLDAGKGGKELKATGGRDKVPETPDFAEWGAPARRSTPFALDDFSSGAPVNTTKP